MLGDVRLEFMIEFGSETKHILTSGHSQRSLVPNELGGRLEGGVVLVLVNSSPSVEDAA